MKDKLQVIQLVSRLHNKLWWLFIKNGVNVSRALANTIIHLKTVEEEDLDNYLMTVTDYIIKGIIPKDEGILEVLDSILEYAGDDGILTVPMTDEDLTQALRDIPVENLPRA